MLMRSGPVQGVAEGGGGARGGAKGGVGHCLSERTLMLMWSGAES